MTAIRLVFGSIALTMAATSPSARWSAGGLSSGFDMVFYSAS